MKKSYFYVPLLLTFYLSSSADFEMAGSFLIKITDRKARSHKVSTKNPKSCDREQMHFKSTETFYAEYSTNLENWSTADDPTFDVSIWGSPDTKGDWEDEQEDLISGMFDQWKISPLRCLMEVYNIKLAEHKIAVRKARRQAIAQQAGESGLFDWLSANVNELTTAFDLWMTKKMVVAVDSHLENYGLYLKQEQIKNMVQGPDGREHLMLIAIAQNAQTNIEHVKKIVIKDGTTLTAQEAFSRVLASLQIIDLAHTKLVEYMESLIDKIDNKIGSLDIQIEQQEELVERLGGGKSFIDIEGTKKSIAQMLGSSDTEESEPEKPEPLRRAEESLETLEKSKKLLSDSKSLLENRIAHVKNNQESIENQMTQAKTDYLNISALTLVNQLSVQMDFITKNVNGLAVSGLELGDFLSDETLSQFN